MFKKQILLTGMVLLFSLSAIAQDDHEMASNSNFNSILAIIELPFLFIAVIFSFLTSQRLKGGIFGVGMKYLAWGFLVMAVGHLHMQIEHYFSINIFNSLLGNTIGQAAWFIALIITWGLSSYGFFSIFKASR